MESSSNQIEIKDVESSEKKIEESALVDTRSEKSDVANDDETKYIDEDDEEDENATNREKFWSERIKNSFKNESMIEGTDKRTKIPNLMEKEVQPPKEFNFINKNPMPLMGSLLPRPKIPSLLTNSFPMYQVPKPLLPTPPVCQQRINQGTPFMHSNFQFQHQLNDFEILKQMLFIANQQQALLNAPLYTDFSSEKKFIQPQNHHQQPNKIG